MLRRQVIYDVKKRTIIRLFIFYTIIVCERKQIHFILSQIEQRILKNAQTEIICPFYYPGQSHAHHWIGFGHASDKPTRSSQSNKEPREGDAADKQKCTSTGRTGTAPVDLHFISISWRLDSDVTYVTWTFHIFIPHSQNHSFFASGTSLFFFRFTHHSFVASTLQHQSCTLSKSLLD